jgi:putative flippase GtrA
MNERANRLFKKDWVLFVVGGALNTALTYAIYLLLKLVMDYRLAYVFAYMVGIVFSYVFNSVIVFNATLAWKGLCTYPVVHVVQFLASVVGLEVLVRIFGISTTWAPLIVTALTVPLTYTMSKLLLTRGRSQKRNLAETYFNRPCERSVSILCGSVSPEVASSSKVFPLPMIAVSIQKKFSSIVSGFKSNFRTHRLLRLLRPYSPARPVWRAIAGTRTFPAAVSNACRVLVATSTGSHWAMSGFESVIVASLKLRGASVEVLLCDGILPACQECDIRLFPDNRLIKEGTAPLCGTCFAPAEKMFLELGVVVKRYGAFLGAEERNALDTLLACVADDDIAVFTWRGISIGEHALAGALRFFGRGTLSGEPFGNDVAREYLRAAMYTAAAVSGLLRENKYDVAVFHHGIYVPQGVVGDVCRLHGVRVVNWTPAYRDRSYLFSHGDSYHKTMIDESVEEWAGFEWNKGKEVRLLDYLESRRSGSNDWISFQRHSEEESNGLLKEIGVTPNRPVIGLLTNVMWDAQLHFRTNAFPSMIDWLLFTIEHFIKRTDVELLIRVHPAEVLGTVPSRQRVVDEIWSRWPTLPDHIHIVAPDDPKNTYALMSACDTVLVYGTKMAIELPCWGIPVVIAGEAWARGKGFTTDVSSVAEYESILSSLPTLHTLSDEIVERARVYAYHLFFRRMIPVKFARKHRYLVPFAYEVNSLAALAPDANPGLDIICEGILSGSPFVSNL